MVIKQIMTRSILTIIAFWPLSSNGFNVEDDERRFLAHNATDLELFETKNWPAHTANFFAKMKKKHANAFMQLISGTKEYESRSKWTRIEYAKSIFKEIKDVDIEPITTAKGVCGYLAHALDLNNEIFINANGACLGEVVDTAFKNENTMKALKPDYFIHKPALVSAKVRSNLWGLNQEVLKVILREPAVCKHMEASLFTSITSKSSASMVSSACFGELKRLEEASFKNIAMFDDSIMEYNGVGATSDTIGALSAKQCRLFSSRTTDHSGCRSFDVRYLAKDAASGLTPECYYKYLQQIANKRTGNQQQSLGTKWSLFSGDILDTILERGPELISHILKSDFKHMKPEHFGALQACHTACKHVPEGADLVIGKDLEIDQRCFGNLKVGLQPQIIAASNISKLPNDLLSSVDSEMMQKWSIKHQGKFLKGHQVLRLIKSGLGPIIHGMSKRIASGKKHACASIPNAGALIEFPAFTKHIDQPCVDALAFKVSAKDTAKLVRVWVMQNMDQLLEGRADSKVLPNLDSKIINSLASSKTFCQKISYSSFSLIRLDALAGMKSKCFKHLTLKRKLREEQIAAMPKDVLEYLDKDSWGNLKWNQIPASHFAKLGSRVEDHQSAFKVMKPKQFVSLKPVTLESITDSQWRIIKPSLFTALKPSKISEIPPKVLAYWSRKQVEALSDAALLKLSKKQIENLGNKRECHPIKVLKRCISKFSVSQQELIRGKIDSIGDIRWWWFIFSFIAIITVAGLVYGGWWFYKRRQMKRLQFE